MKPTGVHVRRSKGREYHMLRGVPGSTFWRTGDSEDLDDYLEAYLGEKRKLNPLKTALVQDHVDRWLDSPEFLTKGDRTRADYRKWILRFAAEFRDLQIEGVQDPKFRGHLKTWRNKWSSSPREADYALTVSVLFLNWLVDEAEIENHNCHKIGRLYKGDRSERILTPGDIAAVLAIAPEPAKRLLIAAVNTGLRPGDLVRLSPNHVEVGRDGRRRIRIRTNKRKRIATIPVTPALDRLLADTPKRTLILVTERGQPFTTQRASQYLKYWMRRAGLSDDLALTDCRGTAATNLLLADASLSEIAAHMGWSLRYAQNVIDRYAEVVPEMAERLVVKLASAR